MANSCDMTFCGCPLLRNINLSYVDTKDVIDMGEMFEEFPSLERLDLSSFDTSNVKDMYWMFGDCTNLNNIKVGSNWSTTLAENTNFNNSWYNHSGYGTQNGIWYMFYNCGVDHVTK